MATVAAPDRLTRTWLSPAGVVGWLSAVNHKQVGRRYIVTAFLFFLLAGRDGLRIRTQLARPELDFLTFEEFNKLFTMHGTVMMLLFAVPIMLGVATYLTPLMIGARDLAFPRLSAFGYWSFLFGGLFLYSSLATDAAPDGGWTAYPPLSGAAYSPDRNLDYWLLGVAFVAVSAVAAALGLIVSILTTRAPGMALDRVPLFVWSILVAAVLVPVGFLSLVAGSALLELDRAAGSRFYDPAAGGNPLLWQHYFWVFGQAVVYVMLLPALGIVSMIVPTFTRRPIVGYRAIVVALAATAVLGLGVWVLHMVAVGLPTLALNAFGAVGMLTAATIGVGVVAWMATIWAGRPVVKTPLLWVFGFFVVFVIGGIVGVMLASVPFNEQAHDTYVVVAYLHYVTIGGVVFPLFGGFYYWFPKLTGRQLSEGLGHVSFWLVFVGTNLTFFPQFLAGFQGMPRRVYTYGAELDVGLWNLLSTLGAYVFAVGVVVFTTNAIWTRVWGRWADENPWGAGTLEWATTSPPPPHNFRTLPTVRSREPLWDQPEIGLLGREQEEAALAAPGEAPAAAEPGATPRETVRTTVVDAVAERVILLAGPSLWPFVLAAAATVSLVGILLRFYPAPWLGVLLAVVALAGWHWPERGQRPVTATDRSTVSHAPPDDGLDARETGWMGMWSAIVCQAVLLMFLVIPYAYLGAGAGPWPPDGIGRPDLLVPAVGTIVLLVSLAPIVWVGAGLRERNRIRLLLGLAAGFVLGAVFLGVAAYEYARQGFEIETNAYASAFLVLLAFHGLQAAAGLVALALVLLWTWIGQDEAQPRRAIRNAALNWSYVVASWLVVAGVLYLSPYIFR